MAVTLAPGLIHHPGWLSRTQQEELLVALRDVVRSAPLFTPRMPRTGKAFTVRMTNCGPLGWVSDVDGYRYQPTHPGTGASWPPIPEPALAVWRALSGYPDDPEACLVNHYVAGAKMGLHQDRDEQALDAPVVSISLGDAGVFRFGGVEKGGPTRSIRLESGDALVMGGPSRLVRHGVDRILAGSSTLSPHGGRINLTLRRVTKPSS